MAEAPHNISYMNYADSESDFKRKADPKKDIRMSDDEEENEHEGEGKFPGKPNDYFIKELLSERVQMDGKYPHADRLLQQGIREQSWGVCNTFHHFLMCLIPELAHAKQNGKLPHKDIRYVDLYREKPIKVVVKVTVPVKEHPKVRESHSILLFVDVGLLCLNSINFPPPPPPHFSSTLSANCSGQRATPCDDYRRRLSARWP